MANINKLFNGRDDAIKSVDGYGSMILEANRKAAEEPEPEPEPSKAKSKRRKSPLEHGSIIRTRITCKKIPCYMRDSACRWFIVKKAKIF